ncbi:MAG: CRISPR-associated protein Cas4 [Candidatus Omnitrophica bacterium]|nr:CRISPR-associated protein Cas4 [Candidatus Omnitrophota bacterium]
MYEEDDFIQLSALQHFLFCERQCALAYIEQTWEENLFTAEGKIMHDKAHEEQFEKRPGIRIERALPLRSKELGLNGKADVVEFHRTPDGKGWFPFPVEYKRGKPKLDDCDKVQLCAQAMCLEEMLDVSIPSGAIFYGRTRRRLDVIFDDALRNETKETAERLHEFIKQGKTPKPVYSKKCKSCSLMEVCIPRTFELNRPVANYIHRMIDVEDSDKRLET